MEAMDDDAPTVILTRPDHASRRFATALERRIGRSIRIVVSPIIDIVPVVPDLDLSTYKTLIFTSENALHALPAGSTPSGRLAYAVGDRTARVAEAAGLRAVSAGGDAQTLIERLLEDAPPGPWLHVGGEHQRVDIAKALTEAGHPTDSTVVYRQEARGLGRAALEALLRGRAILPVFSPRSAALLAAAMPADASDPVIVAISPAAAAAWSARARAVHVAGSPEAEAMVAAVAHAIEADSPC